MIDSLSRAKFRMPAEFAAGLIKPLGNLTGRSLAHHVPGIRNGHLS